MPSTMSNEQVLDFIKQLPIEQKYEVLLSMAREAQTRRRQNTEKAETSLKQLAREKGLNWESLNEEERITFVDGLVHETR